MPKKYKSIDLFAYFNVSFKINTKALKNIIGMVADKLINPSQTVLLPGHNILGGVIVLHETIHKLQKEKNEWIDSKTIL
jgi:hypothetical protein